MTSQQYEQIVRLFHSALDLPSSGRMAFLDEACGSDEELRSKVERMLGAHEQAGDFLSTPLAAVAAEAFTDETDDPIVGRQIGHYRIVSSIGAGGMGEVYLAEDRSLGRRIAIKLLPPEFTANADRVHRFEREARAASALNHPNIITIHEIGKADGLHFIATEFIEGETLRDRIGNGAMPIVEALDIAIQIAAALAAAHEAGIVHRDIKPENVMLRPDGFVKVLDFGLAKLTEERRGDGAMGRRGEEDATLPISPVAPSPHLTSPGVVLGTAAYMSPEQARGQKVDARADIWSLGIVLYEMVGGVRPFTGQTSVDVLVSILERQPAPLSSQLPQVDPAFDRIVMRALEKETEQRYPTIRQFSHELKELRHRLEFEAELKRPLPSDPHELETAKQRPLETVASARPKTDAAQTSVESESVRKRSPAIAIVVVAFALTTIGAASWRWMTLSRVAPTSETNSATARSTEPEMRLIWWLLVQKMMGEKADGTPYQSSGNNDFANGWRFQFNLTGPQSGYLYLINEGLNDRKVVSLNLLFPTPKNNDRSAGIEANKTIQTDWNRFDRNEGVEKFWIVWSANPVNEIEAVKELANPDIKDPIPISQFLNIHAAHSQSIPDTDRDLTTVRWRGEVMVSLVKLKHR